MIVALWLLLFGLPIAVAYFANFYMGVATFSYFTMVTALRFRKKNYRLHGKLMGLAIAIDLSLVGILEFSRDAIHTAASFTLTPWQQAHVFFSVIAALSYFPLLYSGLTIYFRRPPNPRLKNWHKRIGWLAFAARTLGFLLMFSLLGRN